MPRKARQHPMTEGVLRQLYELFFSPLISYKPHTDSLGEWMDRLFDSDGRTITRYKARTPFMLPGLFCASALVRYQGLGYRKVKPGCELWVRHDTHTPDAVDVEYISAPGDQCFLLTAQEWESIVTKLDEVKDGQ